MPLDQLVGFELNLQPAVILHRDLQRMTLVLTEADSANSALLRAMPIGLVLLTGFLLWQFESLRLVALVLLTFTDSTL